MRLFGTPNIVPKTEKEPDLFGNRSGKSLKERKDTELASFADSAKQEQALAERKLQETIKSSEKEITRLRTRKEKLLSQLEEDCAKAAKKLKRTEERARSTSMFLEMRERDVEIREESVGIREKDADELACSLQERETVLKNKELRLKMDEISAASVLQAALEEKKRISKSLAAAESHERGVSALLTDIQRERQAFDAEMELKRTIYETRKTELDAKEEYLKEKEAEIGKQQRIIAGRQQVLKNAAEELKKKGYVER